MKKALITGVTGQDGSYLTELLLSKGYEVHGMKRRTSSFNTQRIDHIYESEYHASGKFFLHHGDLTDTADVYSLMSKIQPDEVYNLGAQSHVAVSFENPIFTSEVNALGALRLLEAIRLFNLKDKTRYYQASTSELFGQTADSPQTEATLLQPNSPYAVAKLYAHWITKTYREAHGIFACNGILFNHESPRRGETFVTRKITRGLVRLANGSGKCLELGNINSQRDWGHARDYVYMQWQMLQQKEPDDYVISSGVQQSVRQFLIWAGEALGLTFEFEGEHVNEVATVKSIIGNSAPALKPGDIVMRVNPRYFRSAEVPSLLGDAKKARDKLGWIPKISARDLCFEMVQEDLKAYKANPLK